VKVWVLVGYTGNTHEIDGAEVLAVCGSRERADVEASKESVGRGRTFEELGITEHEVLR
jgi:hypothetical protein